MQLFDWIYIGEVGAHDGDWEHVTLRLTSDASQVLGIYYSAHRYISLDQPILERTLTQRLHRWSPSGSFCQECVVCHTLFRYLLRL